LLQPLIDDEVQTQTDLAKLQGVPGCRVGKAMRLVRRELELQGLTSDERNRAGASSTVDAVPG
jgi:hypothetical protein